jgi:hypothetical protein
MSARRLVLFPLGLGGVPVMLPAALVLAKELVLSLMKVMEDALGWKSKTSAISVNALLHASSPSGVCGLPVH